MNQQTTNSSVINSSSSPGNLSALAAHDKQTTIPTETHLKTTLPSAAMALRGFPRVKVPKTPVMSPQPGHRY